MGFIRDTFFYISQQTENLLKGLIITIIKVYYK